MKFSEIIDEYLLFVQHIILASDTLSNVLKNGNDFLLNYCKDSDFNIDFARELDSQLFCMENFRLEIDEIIDYVENCSLTELKIPKKEKENNIISIFLKNLDDNLYVDLNSKLNLNKSKEDGE